MIDFRSHLLALFALVVMSSPLHAAEPTTKPKVSGELPDPFVFADGRRVKTAEDWRARREELLKLILHHQYGNLPPAPKRTIIRCPEGSAGASIRLRYQHHR